jgi:hypothetical protein
LHALEKVIVRQYGGDSAEEMVNAAGATFESFDQHMEIKRVRSRMPEWKRNFDKRVAELAHGTGRV